MSSACDYNLLTVNAIKPARSQCSYCVFFGNKLSLVKSRMTVQWQGPAHSKSLTRVGSSPHFTAGNNEVVVTAQLFSDEQDITSRIKVNVRLPVLPEAL